MQPIATTGTGVLVHRLAYNPVMVTAAQSLPRVRAAAAVLAITAALTAQSSWPQFRGPGSRGLALGPQPLPAKLDPATARWRVAVGPGHSSPAVHGDRVFVTAARDELLETLCFDRETGESRWTRSVSAQAVERTHRINSAASPTPATDGERVCSYFGSFGVVCYDVDGGEVWRREMKLLRNTFGSAASPILHDGRLILIRDTDEESTLFVLDAKTGEVVRQLDRAGFRSAWSTPVIWNNAGVEELLVYGAFKLTAYALEDGRERWSVPGLADEPATTPVTGDGLVFVTSYNMRTNPEVIGLPKFSELLERYDDNGNATLDRREVEPNESILSRNDADGEGDHPLRGFFRWLDANRDGELSEKEWQKIIDWLGSFEHRNALVAIRPGDDERDAEIAWQHGRGVPECPSPLWHEGLVYLVKNGGIASCLDGKTGRLHYQERIGARGPRYSSPVAGDGKVYAASARGQITVWKTGPALEVLAQNELGERIMATPALVDGRVYVRTEAHLYCF